MSANQSPVAVAAVAAIRGRSGRLWLTSDTHFGHQNIILYSQRPYLRDDGSPDVRRMDEDLVERWNARVQEHDTVLHLGDLAFGPVGRQFETVRRLVGHKALVMGNHDRLSKKQYRDMGFEHVVRSLRLGRLHMVHWPPVDYEPPADCDLLLHGHVHERWAARGKCINVGVDVRGLQPVTLEELGIDEKLAED